MPRKDTSELFYTVPLTSLIPQCIKQPMMYQEFGFCYLMDFFSLYITLPGQNILVMLIPAYIISASVISKCS